MRANIVKTLLVLVWATLAGCGPGQQRAEHPHEHHHWGYQANVEGPTHWGELESDYAACKTGHAQSPIDIGGVASGPFTGLQTAYKDSAIVLENNGHTVQVNYDPGSTIEYEGKQYALKQFHFHAHSEHTIAGVPRAMEMHLVHQAEDGTLAVVGVFIEKGSRNPVLQPIFDVMPTTTKTPTEVTGTINAATLLPASKKGWTYKGSLTTPPCTEGVTWLVMESPIQASEAQIQNFTMLYQADYRPTQPLYKREVHIGH